MAKSVRFQPNRNPVQPPLKNATLVHERSQLNIDYNGLESSSSSWAERRSLMFYIGTRFCSVSICVCFIAI